MPGAFPAGADFDLDFELCPQMGWIGRQLQHYGVKAFRVEGEIANPHSVVEQGLVGVAPRMDPAAIGGFRKEVDRPFGDLSPILYGAAGSLFAAFGEGLPAHRQGESGPVGFDGRYIRFSRVPVQSVLHRRLWAEDLIVAVAWVGVELVPIQLPLVLAFAAQLFDGRNRAREQSGLSVSGRLGAVAAVSW